MSQVHSFLINNKPIKKSTKNRSWSSLLLQIALSAAIGIAFVLYVWLIQVKYDAVLAAQGGKHNWHTALYFGLVIFTGSFSYDCAKKVLLLDPGTFAKFWQFLREALLDTFLMYVFLFASSFLLDSGLTATGALMYCAALFFVFSAVRNFTTALEHAAK